MNNFSIRGASVFGLAMIAGRIAQAASFFFLARMLDESSMGVVSVLTIIYTALFQFTNLGFERYIVYCQEADQDGLRKAINAVWSLQLIRTGVILLATVGLAIFFAGSSKYNIGTAHIAAIALAVIFMSSTSPDLSTHERTGNFGFIARARGYSSLAGSAATIGCVLIWPSPWAFVIGQIVTAAAFMMQSYLYSTYMPRISWSRTEIGKVFNYCKHVLIIAVVSFIAAQLQNIYVASMFAPSVLGVYFTWYRFVNLPRDLVTQYATRLQFARASSDVRNGEDLMESYLRGFAFTMVALLPFHAFIFFHGDFLITLVAGERWAHFWWGGKLMAIASMLLALSGTIGPYNLINHPHISSMLRTFEATTTLALMVLLGAKFGLQGVLYSVVIVMAMALAFRIYLIYKVFVTRNRLRHAKTEIFIIVVCAAPFMLIEWVVYETITVSWQSEVAGVAYLVLNTALFLYTWRRGGRLIGGIN